MPPLVSSRSALRPPLGCRPHGPLLSAAVAVALGLAGCQQSDLGGLAARRASGLYPPAPQTPRVIALGTLSGGHRPSQAEIDLALFLFGSEPQAPLLITSPVDLACQGNLAWVCDAAVGGVLALDLESAELRGSLADEDAPASAVDVAPDGSRFVCTHGGVVRYALDGTKSQNYRLETEPFRPGGVAAVGESLWVSNVPLNRIEVFDIASGRHMRSFGGRGHGPVQFGIPRSLARTPDGNVCVVDVLNNRVQVLDPGGNWVRDVGAAGDSPGCFGRPRDVAVGPDGTIFVSDAFSQRVHAFAPTGEPLLAFGEPVSGVGALLLPAGIAISSTRPPTRRAAPAGLEPQYYVLVAEQLERPGIRVYGWLGGAANDRDIVLPVSEASDWTPLTPGTAALNPHWRPDHCNACHESAGGRWQPIPAATTDALCISCHDGVKAPADPHPIGRPAVTERIRTPENWPTHEGTIGCLTCHEIRRHCDPSARRPAVNSILLRGYDPQQPLGYCANCHTGDVGGRFSPHRQTDDTGRVREDACFFCHTQRPEIPADGRRRFEPHLRVESSDLCLNCHSRHWDLSPRGHVERPVTPEIRAHMLRRERVGVTRTVSNPARDEPARLPLGDGNVTCYTCHNPHYAGMFPPNTELGALATDASDRAAFLRTDWIDLCSECHER